MIDILLITLALGGSYLWVSVPALQTYSLQLTALLFLIYIASKRLRGTRLHHVLPTRQTAEAALLTAALALLVGSSGGLTSPFLPFFHLLIFVSVLTLDSSATAVKMVGLVLFLWATSPQPFSQHMWIEILTLPVLTPFMLFARKQLDEGREAQYYASLENELMGRQESHMLLFLTTFLRPKISYIRQMLSLGQHSPENVWSVLKQLELLEKEIETVSQEIDKVNNNLPESLSPEKEV